MRIAFGILQEMWTLYSFNADRSVDAVRLHFADQSDSFQNRYN